MTIINPFKVPNVHNEKNKQIVKWINDKIKYRLKFQDCMEKIEEIVKSGKKEEAEIAMYYVSNIIMNTKFISSDNEKQSLISGLQEELNNM